MNQKQVKKPKVKGVINTVRQLVNSDQNIDVYPNTGRWNGIVFINDSTEGLTEYGKNRYKSVLGTKLVFKGNSSKYIILLDENLSDKKTELLKELFWGNAGYISASLHDKIWKKSF